MTKSLRLAFMGTPAYALPSLEQLLDSQHHLLGIWTKRAAPRGRGQKIQQSAVADWAHSHNIPCRSVANLNDPKELAAFQALNLDAALVVSFGILLPEPFLQEPPLGVLNLHPSLLPRWRGAAPIERALWAGDRKAGTSIMLLGAGLDDGPLLAQQAFDLDKNLCDAGAVRQHTSSAGASLLLETLNLYAAGELQPKAQDERHATYAEKIKKEELKIDWQLKAEEIICQVAALSPKPGAWFSYKDKRIHLLEAERADTAAAAPAGTILDGNILDDAAARGTILDDAAARGAIIACGTGAIKLKKLQLEGKKPLPLDDFLRGHPFTSGDKLN